MKMPIIPKLAGGALPSPSVPHPESETEAIGLDMFEAADIDALQRMAEDAIASGAFEYAGAPAEDVESAEAPATSEEVEGEDVAEDAGEVEELDEEAAAAADAQKAQQVATLAMALVGDAQVMVDRFEALLTEADASDYGDPKMVKKLAKEAEGLFGQIEKQADVVQKAADAEDVEGTADAMAELDDLSSELAAVFEQAKASAGPNGATAAGPAPPGMAERAPPPAAPPQNPLSVWAKRAAAV